jgi:hypothetical protein
VKGVDRTVLTIGGVVVAIVVIAAVVVLALGEPDVTAYPADTPEGSVQRYLRAIYDGDATTALGYVSARADKEMGDDPFSRLFCEQSDGHQVRITDVESSGERATVQLRIEDVSGSGLGFDRYSWDRSVVLIFEDSGWKIDEPYFCA